MAWQDALASSSSLIPSLFNNWQVVDVCTSSQMIFCLSEPHQITALPWLLEVAAYLIICVAISSPSALAFSQLLLAYHRCCLEYPSFRSMVPLTSSTPILGAWETLSEWIFRTFSTTAWLVSKPPLDCCAARADERLTMRFRRHLLLNLLMKITEPMTKRNWKAPM